MQPGRQMLDASLKPGWNLLGVTVTIVNLRSQISSHVTSVPSLTHVHNSGLTQTFESTVKLKNWVIGLSVDDRETQQPSFWTSVKRLVGGEFVVSFCDMSASGQ